MITLTKIKATERIPIQVNPVDISSCERSQYLGEPCTLIRMSKGDWIFVAESPDVVMSRMALPKVITKDK